MTDQNQAQEQELSERQKLLARRWHATDTWRMSQDEFRARARTGEFTPEAEASEAKR